MKNRVVLVLLLFCVSVLTAYSQTPQQSAQNPLRPTQQIVKPVMPNGPDLVITNVTGVPNAITSLDPNGECPYFFATVTVKNVGNQDAWFPANAWIIGGESQYTNISAPGQITNTQTTTRRAIRPEESWTATLAGKVKCLRGNPVTISFEVDPQKVVKEANESNNKWSKSVPNQAVPNLGQKPDLIIQRVSFTPQNPDYYSRVMIDVELKNIGAGPAVFCSSDLIWMSKFETANSGGGGAGSRVILPNEVIKGGLVIKESGELQNGCYRVFVQVDPHNAIDESNENNNTYTAYLSLGGVSCQSLMEQDRKRQTSIRMESVPLRNLSTTPMIRVP